MVTLASRGSTPSISLVNTHAGTLAEGLAKSEARDEATRRAPRTGAKLGDPRHLAAIDADERNLRRLLAVIAGAAIVLAGAVAVVYLNQGTFA